MNKYITKQSSPQLAVASSLSSTSSTYASSQTTSSLSSLSTTVASASEFSESLSLNTNLKN